MTKYTSYFLILLGAAVGWAVALFVPGFSAGVGIALGVAVGIAAAADRHGKFIGCRLFARSRGGYPRERR